MDTAVIVLKASQLPEVSKYLTQTLPRQSAPWIIEINDTPAIFVNVVPAKDADLEPEDHLELEQRLKSDALLAILVDVAVRNVGVKELRAFVAGILERFDGLASDDLLEHWWTIEELKSPSLFGSQVFWPHDVRSGSRGS